jgi:hypothetical protein
VKRKRRGSKKSSNEEESKEDHEECKPIEVETYYGDLPS